MIIFVLKLPTGESVSEYSSITTVVFSRVVEIYIRVESSNILIDRLLR